MSLSEKAGDLTRTRLHATIIRVRFPSVFIPTNKINRLGGAKSRTPAGFQRILWALQPDLPRVPLTLLRVHAIEFPIRPKKTRFGVATASMAPCPFTIFAISLIAKSCTIAGSEEIRIDDLQKNVRTVLIKCR